MTAPAPAFVLGLDAGGAAARWALGDDGGTIRAEGETPAFSGLQMLDDDGRVALDAALAALAQALPERPRRVWAGVTGLEPDHARAFARRLADALGIAAADVRAGGDIELLCRGAFAPGEGIVLYAGTGSVAAHLASDGTLERAGGRGALIDDAGGGHWIARQALQRVWRDEDEAPGAWRASPMARALFERIGGSDWRSHRAWLYGRAAPSRGEFGRLALAVGETADRDPAARRILDQAGRELARLALALTGRCGRRPIARAGRVFALHPLVEASLRAALPADTELRTFTTPPHHAAARLALEGAGPASAGGAA